jgi:hypothetical protein
MIGRYERRNGLPDHLGTEGLDFQIVHPKLTTIGSLPLMKRSPAGTFQGQGKRTTIPPPEGIMSLCNPALIYS